MYRKVSTLHIVTKSIFLTILTFFFCFFKNIQSFNYLKFLIYLDCFFCTIIRNVNTVNFFLYYNKREQTNKQIFTYHNISLSTFFPLKLYIRGACEKNPPCPLNIPFHVLNKTSPFVFTTGSSRSRGRTIESKFCTLCVKEIINFIKKF